MNLNKSGMKFYRFLCDQEIFEQYCYCFIDDPINRMTGETVKEFLDTSPVDAYVDGAFLWEFASWPENNATPFWCIIDDMWMKIIKNDD